MESVYVVIENGESYPTAYANFALAIADVKSKHAAELRWYLEQLGYATFEEALAAGETFETDVKLYERDPTENPSGTTSLYIEKGIHINILRLPVKAAAGGKRSQSRSRKRSSRSHKV